MKNIVSVVLVALCTWCFVYLYHLMIGINTITEFFVVFIAIGLLINGIYFVWSITSIKRKFKKQIRMDADRRMRENPDEETQILYRKENFL